MSYLGPTCLLKAALKAALKEGVLYKEIYSVVWVPLKSVEAMYGAYRHAHPHPCTSLYASPPTTVPRSSPLCFIAHQGSFTPTAHGPLLHMAPYCTWRLFTAMAAGTWLESYPPVGARCTSSICSRASCLTFPDEGGLDMGLRFHQLAEPGRT